MKPEIILLKRNSKAIKRAFEDYQCALTGAGDFGCRVSLKQFIDCETYAAIVAGDHISVEGIAFVSELYDTSGFFIHLNVHDSVISITELDPMEAINTALALATIHNMGKIELIDKRWRSEKPFKLEYT